MAWLLELQPEERKGRANWPARLRGSFPSVQGKQPISPLLSKSPVFQKTSTGFFLETRIPYTSEALKKENVRKYLEGAAVDQAVFAVQLSILNRMRFLTGFAEFGSGSHFSD
jgi:hypothetical protein